MEQTKLTSKDYSSVIISKQLYHIKKTLLVNLNFCEREFIKGNINEQDKDFVCDMNQELLDCLLDISDDYSSQ